MSLYDQTWTYSIGPAGLYLTSIGKAKIADVSDMTGPEAKTVVDFLIERKRAGQFRTLHSAFEEQVQLLTNRDVDVINCWEPAVREANKALGEGTTRYAYTKEGYYKWGHGAYIASQAASRGNLDNIYKVLNYFMDGGIPGTSGARSRVRGSQHGPWRQVHNGPWLVRRRHRRPEADREESGTQVLQAVRQHHHAHPFECEFTRKSGSAS